MKNLLKKVLSKDEKKKKNKENTTSTFSSSSIIESTRNSAKRQNTRINKNEPTKKNTKKEKAVPDGKTKINAKQLLKAQRDAELSSSKSQTDYTLFKRNMFWFTSAIGILACVGFLCMFFLSITQYVMDHKYFDIDTIIVHGAEHFNDDEIKQISGISEGTNSFGININAIKSRMYTNAWIEHVEITRKLPRTLEIHITERIPQFLIVHENTLYYVDTKGQLISPISTNDFKSLPILDLGESPNETLEVLPLFISQIREKSEDFTFSLYDMAWLRVSASNGIEMFWESKGILLVFDIVNIEKNITNMQFVIKDLTRKNELSKVAQIHAGNGQAWFVYK